MKEVILKIPEQKVTFVIELIEQLGLEITEVPTIPEEHKMVIRKRIQQSSQNPERLIEWEKVKDNFKLD